MITKLYEFLKDLFSIHLEVYCQNIPLCQGILSLIKILQ
jgi:hypothetical protein